MDYYKVVVYVPEQFLNKMMEEINFSMSPICDHYDHVFSYSKIKGTWRPLPGAQPYEGKIGEIQEAEEIKLEFTIKTIEIESVLNAIKITHPYEKPVIDVYPIKIF